MPLALPALAILAAVPGARIAVRVELLGLLRRDDAYLVVSGAVLALGIADGVDVQPRSRGLARQLAESVNKLLLQVIGQVVLGAEEDNSALGDCSKC